MNALLLSPRGEQDALPPLGSVHFLCGCRDPAADENTRHTLLHIVYTVTGTPALNVTM